MKTGTKIWVRVQKFSWFVTKYPTLCHLTIGIIPQNIHFVRKQHVGYYVPKNKL